MMKMLISALSVLLLLALDQAQAQTFTVEEAVPVDGAYNDYTYADVYGDGTDDLIVADDAGVWVYNDRDFAQEVLAVNFAADRLRTYTGTREGSAGFAEVVAAEATLTLPGDIVTVVTRTIAADVEPPEPGAPVVTNPGVGGVLAWTHTGAPAYIAEAGGASWQFAAADYCDADACSVATDTLSGYPSGGVVVVTVILPDGMQGASSPPAGF